MKNLILIISVLVVVFSLSCSLEDDQAWLYGDWLTTTDPYLMSRVTSLGSDGSIQHWENYNKTDAGISGTYQFDGSTLIIDTGGEILYNFIQINDDHFQLIYYSKVYDYYRKDTCPISVPISILLQNPGLPCSGK